MKRSNKGNLWQILGIIIVVLLALIFFWLKKGDEKEKITREVQAKEHARIPAITEVKIKPAEPKSIDSLEAMITLVDPKMKRVKYRYQWFVNGEAVPEVNKKRLLQKFYKKGDKVYCKVRALRGNRYASKEIKSNKVEIGNSPPKVNLSIIGNFEVPGRFQYAINASDPDDDPLTYHLVSPLDRGIDINPESGEIEWYIDEQQVPTERSGYKGGEDIVVGGENEAERNENQERKIRPESKKRKFSPIVKIVFEVRDSDGGVALSFISLNLLEGGEDHE